MGINTELKQRGRIVIPKKLRNELNLRSGQILSLERKGAEIIIRPSSNANSFISELKGCIKTSGMDPLELKKIWEKI